MSESASEKLSRVLDPTIPPHERLRVFRSYHVVILHANPPFPLEDLISYTNLHTWIEPAARIDQTESRSHGTRAHQSDAYVYRDERSSS
jgi:hypothetical protein